MQLITLKVGETHTLPPHTAVVGHWGSQADLVVADDGTRTLHHRQPDWGGSYTLVDGHPVPTTHAEALATLLRVTQDMSRRSHEIVALGTSTDIQAGIDRVTTRLAVMAGDLDYVLAILKEASR